MWNFTKIRQPSTCLVTLQLKTTIFENQKLFFQALIFRLGLEWGFNFISVSVMPQKYKGVYTGWLYVHRINFCESDVKTKAFHPRSYTFCPTFLPSFFLTHPARLTWLTSSHNFIDFLSFVLSLPIYTKQNIWASKWLKHIDLLGANKLQTFLNYTANFLLLSNFPVRNVVFNHKNGFFSL